MNLKILVFPCGSEIGLEIYRALGAAKELTLFGGSSVGDHGEFVYKNYIPGIPFVSDDRFIPEVNRIVKKYSIDYVVPAHDSVINALAGAADKGKLSCKLLTSPFDTCRISYSKKLTHEFFSGLLPLPKLYNTLGEVKKWPIFLKPEIGCGSKGTAKCLNSAEAEYYLGQTKGLLILEYLPGKEYTVDCFTDRNGRLLFCGGRERTRISNGISVRTAPFRHPSFRKMAEIINNKLKFRGMWFFQVKENSAGQMALMETAPRIAGAMGLYRNLGVNFALMSLYDAEGYPVDMIQNDFSIVFDRALESKFKTNLDYRRVYVDWDDCILLRGGLNLQMVTFLYQCVNNGVDIVLLTRHAGDLARSLRKHRLEQVFKSVIQIKDKTPKSAFVKNRKAIFIDDSFAERAEVFKNAGIPVFAPDAVESLLISQ